MSTIPKIANSSARPSTKNAGDTYYQADIGRLILWSGSAWVEYDSYPRDKPTVALSQGSTPYVIRATITTNGSDLYTITLATNSSFTTGVQTKTRTTAGYVDFNVSANDLYYVKVTGSGTSGDFEYSMDSTTASRGTAPVVPTLSSQTYDSQRIYLSWTNVAGETGYQLYRRTGTSGSFSRIQNNLSYSRVDGGLSAGATYQYYVDSYNAYGTSSASNIVTETAGKTLSTPALALSSKTFSAITVNWSNVVNATATHISINGGSYVSTSGSTHTFTGLTPETTYTVRVRLTRTYESGQVAYSYSNQLSVTTEENPQLKTPTLSLTSRTTSSLTVTPSSADTGVVYYVKLGSTLRSTSTGAAQTFTGLAHNTTYGIVVYAQSDDGRPPSASATFSFTTSQIQLNAPSLSLTKLSDTSFRASWSGLMGATTRVKIAYSNEGDPFAENTDDIANGITYIETNSSGSTDIETSGIIRSPQNRYMWEVGIRAEDTSGSGASRYGTSAETSREIEL